MNQLISIGVLAVVVIDLVAPRDALSAQDSPSPNIRSGNQVVEQSDGGAYCGLYSAARMGSLLGKRINPRHYASARYVTSYAGSTPAQIREILQENGIGTVGLQRLSAIDLMASGGPFIANVRKLPDTEEYDHWVCVHRMGGKLAVYDGARPAELMKRGEFLAIWNGYAIVPRRIKDLIALYTVRLTLMLLGIAASVILVRSGFWRRLSHASAMTLATTSVAAISFILFADPANHLHATRVAVMPWVRDVTPDVELAELIGLANEEGETQLVDARLRADYQRGSLPGAVNIPVDSSTKEVQRKASDLNKSASTVVFCQSEPCAFDRRIAKRLRLQGFTSVRVARVGVAEYRRATQELEELLPTANN